ncbi:hypothetical protein WN51_00486, partial [Melipona quadrifasciata]
VKSNPPLPSVYRARPQGPPGLPRHPVNNGPVAQPRPSGQHHQQIRFDTRPPVGQANPVQFGQVRPYGPPRPPAGSFPQKSPLQQGQHPPIVLNPRFPPSSVQRAQLGPRPPHPGNYPAPKFQGNVQRPQHPRPEYPNGPYQPRPEHRSVPQQGRNSDVFLQKRLQRDESLLNISQQSLPIKREDKAPSAPRIMVDKMADVDNSRKLRQLENSASKEKTTELRENAENDDDDDDVVMDEKSPRANGDVGQGDLIKESKLSESDVQSARRPENAAAHGKIGTIAEKIGQKISSVANVDEKPVKDSNATECDNRLFAKSNEEERDKLLDKREVDKIGDQPDEPERKLVEDQTQKENADKERVTKPTTQTETNSSSAPSVVEDVVAKLSDSNAKQSTKKSEETKSGRNEQDSKVTSTSGGEPDVALIAKSNESDRKVQEKSPTTELRSSTHFPDKSRAEADQSQKESGQEGLSNSPEQLRGSGPASTERKEQSDRELKTPCSVSQSNSPASTPAKVNQTREKVEQQTREKHDLASVPETKLDVDLLKETREVKNAQEPKEPNTSTETDQRKKEQEPEAAETLKLEKSSEKESSSDLSHSPREKELNDPSSKSPNKSANENEKSSAEGVLENVKSDNLRDTSETNASSVASSPPASEREASETRKSPPKAAEEEEGVKGFDNGEQRSLSIKSSSPQNLLQSPVSPKSLASPVEGEKLEENEKTADDQTTSDSKSLPKSAKSAKVQRAPTPAKRSEKSEKKSPKTPEVENGSVTNESVQSNAEPTTNGVGDSPTKKSPSKSKEADKRSTAGSPIKSPSKSVKSLPRTPETPSSTAGQEKKKLPMNKIQVGAAPSPNLKTVRSKIGSLENASYKPGG